MFFKNGTYTSPKYFKIPFTNILIIEIPTKFEEEPINNIKKDVINPYIIFIYNPNIKEVKTTLITLNK